MLEAILKTAAMNHGLINRLMEDVDDREIDEQPMAGINTPRWILGHIAVTIDYTLITLGEPGRMPEQWFVDFGPGSVPGKHSDNAPEKTELLEAINAGHEEVKKVVVSAPSEKFEEKRTEGFFVEQLPTVGDMVTFLMTTHEAFHIGQLSAWRRMSGRTPLF
ncbi:DinB family protein [Calycomorphotria hydatis]|uniref:DinB superfamily protein n=1 Tax=Calycomorphotria hydatis TaxID=2528027 RepID=A0A517TC02_9PLAN|nr:DinB family protein [Calycomorphotria hydatis]QDT65889.1 DinB superfamily protein [Calycomorphotria hydatis]